MFRPIVGGGVSWLRTHGTSPVEWDSSPTTSYPWKHVLRWRGCIVHLRAAARERFRHTDCPWPAFQSHAAPFRSAPLTLARHLSQVIRCALAAPRALRCAFCRAFHAACIAQLHACVAARSRRCTTATHSSAQLHITIALCLVRCGVTARACCMPRAHGPFRVTGMSFLTR